MENLSKLCLVRDIRGISTSNQVRLVILFAGLGSFVNTAWRNALSRDKSRILGTGHADTNCSLTIREI